jgi:hypothetical protein
VPPMLETSQHLKPQPPSPRSLTSGVCPEVSREDEAVSADEEDRSVPFQRRVSPRVLNRPPATDSLVRPPAAAGDLLPAADEADEAVDEAEGVLRRDDRPTRKMIKTRTRTRNWASDRIRSRPWTRTRSSLTGTCASA